jgi:hypothetical protein
MPPCQEAATTPAGVFSGRQRRLKRDLTITTTTIRLKTPARHRGLDVTILGDSVTGLLAVAGYGTPEERAIAMIAIRRRRGRRVYSVAGTDEWTTSVATVAQAAVKAREARNARVRLMQRREH